MSKALRLASSNARLTNKPGRMPSLDGRTLVARRVRDVLEEHVADLGGFDYLSTAELSLVRRAAVLTAQLEVLEGKNEAGVMSAKTLDLYCRCTGHLNRVLALLGLERRQRDVTPTLEQHLSNKRRAGAHV